MRFPASTRSFSLLALTASLAATVVTPALGQHREWSRLWTVWPVAWRALVRW